MLSLRLLFVPILLLSHTTAMACSCAKSGFEERLQKADFVYLGKIVSNRLVGQGQVRNKLDMIETYKGVPRTLELSSESGNFDACRRLTFVGLNYLVFGKTGETPSFTPCTDTVEIYSDKDWQLDFLRRRAGAWDKKKDDVYKRSAPTRKYDKCSRPAYLARAEQADYVYHGEIIEGNLGRDGIVSSRIRVIEKFKSSPDAPMMNSDSGDFYVNNLFAATGFRYVVFGKKGTTPDFSICSDTEPLYEVSDSLRKILKDTFRVTKDIPQTSSREPPR